MFDHFRFAAPIYDRVIRLYDPQRLHRLLGLSEGVRLLDAGGGTGRVSSRLRPLVRSLVLCDLSAAMLRQAALKGGLNPVRAFCEKLPFNSHFFDSILVVDALHHFGNQRLALAELVRVLKPGGRLVIEEPDVSRPLIKVVAWMEKMVLMGSRFLTSQQIEAMLLPHNLQIRTETDDRYLFWVQGVKSSHPTVKPER